MRIIICLLLFSQFLFGQEESLQVDGAIIVGEASVMPVDSGTIQWNGSNFQGFNGSNWINLDESFNPELPSTFNASSVVLMDSVLSYTVPDGFNLFISDLRQSGTTTVEEGGITGSFNGFNVYLGQHLALALGEGMTIANASKLSFNGFLAPVDVDFIVQNLPYTVPANKTLFITSSKFEFTPKPQIDGFDFFGVRVAYAGQTISGTGSFIGYLK